MVLTLKKNLVEYLTRPTNRGEWSNGGRSTGGKVLTYETGSTRKTTCPSATMSSTNLTRTGLGLNTVLSVESFAMNRVSYGTFWPLALWLVSHDEGCLSNCELRVSVVNSVPRSPASPNRTVQIYLPVNWFNKWFLWNLRCLAACVLRSVFHYAVVMWTGGWKGHFLTRPPRAYLYCLHVLSLLCTDERPAKITQLLQGKTEFS
jgi:hypothetical protein